MSASHDDKYTKAETEINRLLDEAKATIKKLEEDIKKLPERSTLELNLGYFDAVGLPSPQAMQQVEKLKALTQTVRQNYFKEVEKLAVVFPNEKRSEILLDANEQLGLKIQEHDRDNKITLGLSKFFDAAKDNKEGVVSPSKLSKIKGEEKEK